MNSNVFSYFVLVFVVIYTVSISVIIDWALKTNYDIFCGVHDILCKSSQQLLPLEQQKESFVTTSTVLVLLTSICICQYQFQCYCCQLASMLELCCLRCLTLMRVTESLLCIWPICFRVTLCNTSWVSWTEQQNR